MIYAILQYLYDKKYNYEILYKIDELPDFLGIIMTICQVPNFILN